MIASYYFFICALGFLIIEILWPKRFAFLMAIAVAIAGFLPFLVSKVTLVWQCVTFLVLGLFFIAKRLRHIKYPLPAHHYRPKKWLNQTVLLTHPIRKGHGKIKLDNAWWYIQCPTDLPKGTLVNIVRVNGVLLEAVKKG